MRTIKWLYNYTIGKRKLIVFGLLLVCLNALAEIMKIELQKGIVDGFLNHEMVSQVLTCIVLLSLMYIISSFMFYVIGTHFQKISFFTCKKITMELHKKIQFMNIADYDSERFGKWVAIFSDIDSLANELFMVPFKLVDFAKLFMVSVLIYITDKKVLLILVVINSFYILLMKWLLPIIQRLDRDMIEKRHEIIIQFEEGNSGLREIINYNNQYAFMDHIDNTYKRYVNAVKKDISCNNGTGIITSLSKWIGLAIGIYFLYKDVALNKISIGTFFVVYQYMNQFSELFSQLNNYIYELVALKAKVEMMQDTFESIHEMDSLFGISFDEKINHIMMNDISFSYDGKKNVIDHLSGEIKVSHKNVIVGESGKGKSTLIDLFVKSYHAQNGDFIINDTYLMSQINLKSWLAKINIVRQNPYVFCDSIRNNILLGKKGVSDQHLIEVCEIVMLKDYIMKLPNGLDTIIGERGVDISGGQRQRIAIARALVSDAQILIFDESMSALDEYNQQMILKNLELFYSECTIIMVTHQVSMIDSTYNVIYI